MPQIHILHFLSPFERPLSGAAIGLTHFKEFCYQAHLGNCTRMKLWPSFNVTICADLFMYNLSEFIKEITQHKTIIEDLI